jgi:prepilin-type N-terminal cleavage/methylation domain-containing protein
MNKDPKKTGFTLIELLVVIAIIALLLSILMPSLNKVKERARTLLCMSNSRQIGVATISYANNCGYYPQALSLDSAGRAVYKETDTNGVLFWEDRILPYLGNHYNVFLCPSIMAKQKVRASTFANPRRDGRSRTYSLNAYLAGYRGVIGMEDMGGFAYMYGPPMKATQVPQPSLVALLNDVDAWGFGIYEGGCFRTWADCAPWHEVKYLDAETNKSFPPYQIWGYEQRSGNSCWVFADGHAEKITREFILKDNIFREPPKGGMRVDPKDSRNLSGM